MTEPELQFIIDNLSAANCLIESGKKNIVDITRTIQTFEKLQRINVNVMNQARQSAERETTA